MNADNRSLLQRYVPAHFHNPAGLALRLIRTGDPAALYAMWTAALGLALTPLDLILSWRENDLLRSAPDPDLPLVFVCGPSRAGTTLTEQILITCSRPTYLNNLTALFPRSSIIANRAFAPFLAGESREFRFYYGKSTGLSGLNDALYLWDRWLGSEHRTRPPQGLPDGAARRMRRFFGALQREYGLPVLNKNNHLNCCAHLVAPALPTATFYCLHRSREHLAQSLLLGRRDIHGSDRVAYGIPSPVDPGTLDPVESVCRQVLYHERVARWQEEVLGADRFRIVRYEDICERPFEFARAVHDEFFRSTGHAPSPDLVHPFVPSTRLRVGAEVFERIQECFARLEGHEELYWREPPRPRAASSARQY